MEPLSYGASASSAVERAHCPPPFSFFFKRTTFQPACPAPALEENYFFFVCLPWRYGSKTDATCGAVTRLSNTTPHQLFPGLFSCPVCRVSSRGPVCEFQSQKGWPVRESPGPASRLPRGGGGRALLTPHGRPCRAAAQTRSADVASRSAWRAACPSRFDHDEKAHGRWRGPLLVTLATRPRVTASSEVSNLTP